MMVIANIYSAVTWAKHLNLRYDSLIAALTGWFHFPQKETEAEKGYINCVKSHDKLLGWN